MEDKSWLASNLTLLFAPTALTVAARDAHGVNVSHATHVAHVLHVTNTSTFAANAYEWRYILPMYIVIFLLSISGNCLVIATLCSNRRLRTVTNVYLLNLAVSDFLLGVFCLPFTIVGQIYRRFLFGAAMCKIIPYLQAVSVSVGVWTLVAISLERYFAICRPLKSRRWQTQCHAYKMITCVWIFSLILNSPILVASRLQPMRDSGFKCREVWLSLELERAFNLTLDAVLLVVPLFIMVIAYSLIVKKLWRGMKHEIQHSCNWQRQLTRQPCCKICRGTHQLSTSITAAEDLNNGNLVIMRNGTQVEEKMLESEKPQNCMHANLQEDFRHAVRSTHIDKSIEAKRKVIRMLFVIILEFFICWTPLHVVNTVYLLYPGKLYHYIGPRGIASMQLLAYCSSCCNPITYCFMNKKFRQAFVNLLKNRFGCCFSKASDSAKQATPQPSSQDMAHCVIRGSHTGRSELEVLEGEDCV